MNRLLSRSCLLLGSPSYLNMQHVFIILLYFSAAVSLVLSVIAGYCWALSSGKLFDISRLNGPETHSLTIARSELCLWYNFDGYYEGRKSSPRWEFSTANASDLEGVAIRLFSPRQPVAGFFVGKRVGQHSMILLPMALVVLLFGILPAVTIIWHIRCRSRRLSQYRCTSCNYDLRASTHRCPECGTLIAGKP